MLTRKNDSLLCVTIATRVTDGALDRESWRWLFDGFWLKPLYDIRPSNWLSSPLFIQSSRLKLAKKKNLLFRNFSTTPRRTSCLWRGWAERKLRLFLFFLSVSAWRALRDSGVQNRMYREIIGSDAERKPLNGTCAGFFCIQPYNCFLQFEKHIYHCLLYAYNFKEARVRKECILNIRRFSMLYTFDFKKTRGRRKRKNSKSTSRFVKSNLAWTQVENHAAQPQSMLKYHTHIHEEEDEEEEATLDRASDDNSARAPPQVVRATCTLFLRYAVAKPTHVSVNQSIWRHHSMYFSQWAKESRSHARDELSSTESSLSTLVGYELLLLLQGFWI